jgi:tripartite-type tricarboxylate transporter receptor subunit TctC
MKKAVRAGLMAWAAAAVFAGAASAQQYPARPIRIIVAFAPGGPTDVIARIMAQKMSESLGQQVVVDNRPGAGGNIGIGMAANATADGYTLLIVSSALVLNPGLYGKTPYDAEKSFSPVSNMAASPNVFIAHPSVAAKSMQELVRLAQGAPKKYGFATPGIGTTPDLSAVIFRLNTKADIATVPYNGAGPAVVAVIANQVPLGCVAMPPATPHIQGGRLRALAVTTAKRSSVLPDVPTMAEAGFPGQESETLQGLLAPAGTPAAVIQRLHADVIKILAQPDTRERISALGFDIIASSPREFAAQIKTEVVKWTKVVKEAGIKVE